MVAVEGICLGAKEARWLCERCAVVSWRLGGG